MPSLENLPKTPPPHDGEPVATRGAAGPDADRAIRHVDLLSRTTAAVGSSLDVGEVTMAVADAVAEVLDADACFVYVYDRPTDELVLHGVRGVHVDDLTARPRLHPGEGVTGEAARARQPIAISRDAHLDPRFKSFPNLPEERFQSMLAVPIFDRADQLAGAMNVRTVAPRAYPSDEIVLMMTIAAQVGQAIENAHLYDRAQRRVTELEALARVSEAVSQSLYQEEALASIVETAVSTIDAESCALVIAGDGGPVVAHRAGSSAPGDPEMLELARRAPFIDRAALAVPLVWKGRTSGALVATTGRRDGFTRDEQMLLELVAHQAATAVEYGRGVMRTIVAQEIHHRVKNNLQTVASLLRLRSQGTSDPRRALADSVDRVLSIAEVHDLLTASREGEVDLSDLLRRLAAMLGHGLGEMPRDARLVEVEVPGEVATAIALIFCELYANALEHGGGEVTVRLAATEDAVSLVVRDHGPGLPPGFDDSTSNLGLRIARALAADDLRGTLTLENADPGAAATVRWPRSHGSAHRTHPPGETA